MCAPELPQHLRTADSVLLRRPQPADANADMITRIEPDTADGTAEAAVTAASAPARQREHTASIPRARRSRMQVVARG